MAKPNIYTLLPGELGNPAKEARLGLDAVEVHSASYLIEYEKEGIKKYMIVDTGMGGDWPQIKEKIEKIAGSIQNVSHVLLTHLDLDHIQNLKEFPEAIVFHGGQACLLDKNEYGAKQIYADGFIEITEIRYQVVPKAHTKKDTIYIVDSGNVGKIAFMGDLIFVPLAVLSLEKQIAFDSAASVNPKNRFEAVKEFYQQNSDIKKFYLGHYDKPMSYQEVEEYIKTLEKSKEFQKFLLQY